MDALSNMTNNIPNWVTRLDELSGQVRQRQSELAAIAAAEQKNGTASDAKSLRNKGSTESLKPRDDGPANIPAPPPDNATSAPVAAAAEGHEADTPPEGATPNQPSSPVQKDAQQKTPTSPAGSGPGAIAAAHKPPRDAIAAANSRAKVQVKKKVKTASMMSVENPPTTTYRTRSMIIVYYDSYVQKFFDELVRFVSSSRNLLRKAKMAAKVAHIKKMASLEGGDDGETALPSLRYMSTRRMGPMDHMGRPGAGLPGANNEPDVYDKLDKGLEHVQTTCEHGAHQFLRDADCDDEINKIKERLREVLEMATKETERLQSEEAETAKDVASDAGKQRRPVSIRRELGDRKLVADETAGGGPVKSPSGKIEAAHSVNSESSYIEPAVNTLEADSGDEAADIEAMLPKLNYRSTRAMRARPQ